jgi:hypothetical protein
LTSPGEAPIFGSRCGKYKGGLMLTSCKPMRTRGFLFWTLVFVVLFFPLWRGFAAETPRYGGDLVFAVAEPPPSFDGHRETTFAMIHPIAPHYSTLLRFDPHNYPKIVGDVAESWTFSKDGLSLTVKIRKGIKFHDGSALTAHDVKATYDKIIFPPEGVASARKASYAMVSRIEAPDELTVVFRLKHIAASFLANLASPWNFIYSAEKLKKDPRWSVYLRRVRGRLALDRQEKSQLLHFRTAILGQLSRSFHSRLGTAGGRGAERAGPGGVSRLQSGGARLCRQILRQ